MRAHSQAHDAGNITSRWRILSLARLVEGRACCRWRPRPVGRCKVVVAEATEAEGHEVGQHGCHDIARIGTTSIGEGRGCDVVGDELLYYVDPTYGLGGGSIDWEKILQVTYIGDALRERKNL